MVSVLRMVILEMITGKGGQGKQVLIPEAPVHATVSFTTNIILFNCQFKENSGAVVIIYKENGYCSIPRIFIISKWLCVYAGVGGSL
jgi:hypothetical protein